jgi:hypothetical protein
MDLFGNKKHKWEEHWVDMPKFHIPTRDTEKRNKVDVSDIEHIAAQNTSKLPKYNIYIISKGRYNKPMTVNALVNMGIPFNIVVEPKEYEEYIKVINKEKIIVAPENFSERGQGGIPVRNFVLEYSKNKGEKKHWILDDNIGGFGYQKTGRRISTNTNGDFFRECEDFVDRYSNIKMSGIRYRFHHNYVKSPYYLNTRIYSCILMDNSIKHKWRGKYNEDTDLSLRVLKDGDCTMLFTWCFCNKAGTLSVKGGNTDDLYAKTDNRKEFAESLREQHPEHVKVVWRYNRWHHDVNYKPFRGNVLLMHETHSSI